MHGGFDSLDPPYRDTMCGGCGVLTRQFKRQRWFFRNWQKTNSFHWMPDQVRHDGIAYFGGVECNLSIEHVGPDGTENQVGNAVNCHDCTTEGKAFCPANLPIGEMPDDNIGVFDIAKGFCFCIEPPAPHAH